MKITLLVIGKIDDSYLLDGIDKYLKRLKHYIKFDIQILPDIKKTKNLTEQEQKNKEAELFLKFIQPQDDIILLDDKGAELSSKRFADLLNKKMIASVGHLVFLVGGPYGFDNSIYQRANQKLSLSKLTFSHQMVRLFFVEQVYRAFTILKSEPYHHE
ncbi:23S rRNA (pseudouridine(1915)-N(3))-methyltransferase RlmH [Pedobacter psychrophilus]|uniref:Ribosomal RNA large subunit methyltransferase H n=1 Tax=Pedobacter psychrophilus TaxID=1826909 RepID=A0A179DHJ0_9SPHI|nr:23S rRNA (pseudouridine(1915)-N(3))-methyltransferase RlmH [Pedobacter psychrophilus]OAQ39893.1 23S rRNA (pseudouridine(1915)-N(3))-methyltransferase RlmH [Pedobacter psychrophilus]